MTFWIQDYTILFRKDQLHFWPTENMSVQDKLNAITRTVGLLTLVAFLFTQDLKFIWMGLITIGAIIVYERSIVMPEPFVQQRSEHTVPTKQNPLMNILLPEINGNPNRKPALKSFTPPAEKEINDQVKQMLDPRIYKGVRNEMDLEYSMRNFYTTASTTIPNDQEGFSKFCFGDMISSKEGNPTALHRQIPRLGSVG
jgi:hypothetical protein